MLIRGDAVPSARQSPVPGGDGVYAPNVRYWEGLNVVSFGEHV